VDNVDKKDLAYEDYLKGMKYKDIAEKYDVTESAVKSWASRHWKKKKDATNDKKKLQPKNDKLQPKKSRGAPKGNKNAVGNKGGGAPTGNKNRLVTGEFENIFFSSLSEEENALIEAIDIDKYNLLKHELQLLTVREFRMMQKIQEIKSSTKGLNIKDVVKRKLESKNVPYVHDKNVIDTDVEVAENKKYKYIEEETTTHTISDFELLYKLEEALTRIQARKIVCINLLAKMEESAERLTLEKERMNKDTGGDGNIDALMGSIDAARELRSQRGDP